MQELHPRISETVVEAAARFDGCGPAGFLQKPYMLPELRAAVRGALGDGSPGE